MELNYVSSGIQLIGTKINKLKVENTIVDIEKDASRSFSMNINEPHFFDAEEKIFAQIVIDFKLHIEQGENQKMVLDLSLEGAFVSDEKVNKDDFIKLVAVNGAAALVGIARGKIESISSNIFNDGKISIPFINVIDYYKHSLEQSKEDK